MPPSLQIPGATKRARRNVQLTMRSVTCSFAQAADDPSPLTPLVFRLVIKTFVSNPS